MNDVGAGHWGVGTCPPLGEWVRSAGGQAGAGGTQAVRADLSAEVSEGGGRACGGGVGQAEAERRRPAR